MPFENQEVFSEAWQAARARIFGVDSLPQSPFLNRSWRLALVPESLDLTPTGFDGLMAIATAAADKRVGICASGTILSLQPALVVALEREAFHRASYSSELGHIRSLVFGLSARWGLVVSPEDYALIGCESVLYPKLAAAFGGERAMRDRFYNALANEEVGDGERTRPYFDALLDLVGWSREGT